MFVLRQFLPAVRTSNNLNAGLPIKYQNKSFEEKNIFPCKRLFVHENRLFTLDKY